MIRVALVGTGFIAGAHVAVATEALGLGKHVLLEKPADITLERIDGLLEVERESGRTVTPSRWRTRRSASSGSRAVRSACCTPPPPPTPA